MAKLSLLLRESIIYGVGNMMVRSITFLLLPFTTNEFNKSQLSELTLIFVTIGILRVLYSHGIGSGFLKYYQSDDSDTKIVKSTYLIYIILISLAGSFLLYILSFITIDVINNSLVSLLQQYSIYIIFILFFDTLAFRLLDILRVENKAMYYMTANFLAVLSNIIITIVLVKSYHIGIEGVLYGTLSGSVIQLLLLFPLFIKNISLFYFSKSLLNKMVKFGFPFLPAAIFFISMESIDKYLLELMVDNSRDIIGVYSTGCKLASIPMFLITAFNLGWQPFYIKSGDNENSRKQFAKVGTIFTIFIIMVGWLSSIIMPLMMKVNIPIYNKPLIGAQFWGCEPIIPIIVIAYIFYALYIIHMPSLFLHNKQKWSPIFRFFGALINIFLTILLIPYYGMLGAAIATAIGYGSMFMLLYIKNKKWLHIKIPWLEIMNLIVLILANTIIREINIYAWVLSFFVIFLYALYLMRKYGLKNIASIF